MHELSEFIDYLNTLESHRFFILTDICINNIKTNLHVIHLYIFCPNLLLKKILSTIVTELLFS